MNGESMKVSIVVPVYNTGQYLHRCLRSICSQTLKEIEVILVDDGSGDCSGRICDEFAAEDARIHVIHKTNGGQVSARQVGLSFAAGEYAGFVDSDDWIEPDMYRSLYEIAVNNGADVVAEGIIDDIGNGSWKRLNRLPNGKYGTAEEREKIYKGMICCNNFFDMGIQPYLCNKIVRKGLASRHMNRIPQSIRVGEDAAAVYPMLVQADVIMISDMAHYHYCHRNTSVMLRDRQEEQEYENAVLLHTYLEKMFQELSAYEVMREQLRRYEVNNLLTRIYGKYAGLDRESVLFPFAGIFQEDSIIIYGAGAFGRAVYQYAVSHEKLKIKAWIDQKAFEYQSIGLDVQVLEDVDIERADKILVAVFSENAYWQIRERLMLNGAESNQIQWISVEKLNSFINE